MFRGVEQIDGLGQSNTAKPVSPDFLSMFNATIEKKIDITTELVKFWVRPDGQIHDFMAGQYVALGLPGAFSRHEQAAEELMPSHPEKLIKRTYSICSSPEEPWKLEFFVAMVPSGSLSPRLAPLASGERIYLAPKIAGNFTLSHVPADAPLTFVATGTGVAPFISMLRTSSTWTQGRKITLVHGARYSRELGYQEELSALQKVRPEFTYIPVISRDEPEWMGERGRVQKLFSATGELKLDPEKDHVYLCGNPEMITGMEELLMARGFKLHSKKEPGNLHYEKYW